MIGFASSARFVEHDTGPNHPERPDRIRAILTAVRQVGWITSPNPFPDFTEDLGLLRTPPSHPPLPAPKLLELDFSPAAEAWLESVHTPQHIHHVKHVCQRGGGVLDEGDTI